MRLKIYQKLLHAAKAIVTGKFIALSAVEKKVLNK